MMKKILWLVVATVCLFACEKNSEGTPEEEKQQAEILIVNEGQFTKGTSSLTAIFRDGTIVNDAFQSKNNRPLGDVAQSIAFIDGFYYIVVNNSSKVEVVKPDTFESVATILLDSGSPRYITSIGNSKAVVSDYSPILAIIDTKANSVISYVDLSFSFEQMVTVNNKVFGAVGNSIKVFDTNNVTSAGVRTIDLGEASTYQTAQLIVDKNNKIWVLASEWLKGELLCIDPGTEKVVDKLEFPIYKKGDAEYVDGCITGITGFPRIDTDKTRENIYFNVRTLKGTDTSYPYVYCYNITAKTFRPHTELVDLGLMYGMGVSASGEVYVCDALDYSAQRGYVRHYKSDGTVVSHQVGIYPNTVFFTDKIEK